LNEPLPEPDLPPANLSNDPLYPNEPQAPMNPDVEAAIPPLLRRPWGGQ
jgi:hypothetical protein